MFLALSVFVQLWLNSLSGKTNSQYDAGRGRGGSSWEKMSGLGGKGTIGKPSLKKLFDKKVTNFISLSQQLCIKMHNNSVHGQNIVPFLIVPTLVI